MKRYLEERLNTLLDKKKELVERSKTCEDVEMLKSYLNDAEEIAKEMEEVQEALNREDKKFNPLSAMKTLPAENMVNAEESAEMEYRKAFKNYVLEKEPIPQDIIQKASATTYTTDVGAVIPTTIVNRIIDKLNASGMIWSRVTKTNYKGGVRVPVSTAKPVASWVTEGSVADKQKKAVDLDDAIIFNFYKLQVRIAVSLEAATTTLPIFEQTVVDNAVEAILVASETAIVKGTGSGQPKGIVKETVPAERTATATAETVKSYAFWCEVESKMPLAYSAKGVYLMSKITWDKYILGMVDTAGQPIARVNYGLSGRPEYRLLGREVILNDYMADFDAASSGDVVACIVDLGEYLWNSNLQMTMRRYFDENTDEDITKATLIADGKMMDTNGLVFVKK